MTDKSEWQEANRRLMAEQRRALGDPPTAEELLAYSRGELTEQEEERIRDLLVAYPELARMWSEAAPEAPQPGDPDAVSEEKVLASWKELQRRLGGSSASQPDADRRADAQRGRVWFHLHVPTAVAAALALLFFGLFVRAENRARHYQREGLSPRILGEPQELDPDGSRGPAAPTMLQNDGEVYLLEPHLLNRVRYPHYTLELHDQRGVIWTSHGAQPDEDDAFQIVIPRGFLRAGSTYQLRVFGVDGDKRTAVGAYDVAVPSE